MHPLWFDAIVVCILLFGLIRGAKMGLIWQLAWIAAIALAFAFSQTGSVFLAQVIPLESPLDRWVAMFILYLMAALASFGVAYKLRDWLEDWKFERLDNYLGAVFGIIKGALVSLVMVFFVVTLSPELRDVALESHTGYVAAEVMQGLHPVMPGELHDVLHPYIHQLDDADDNEELHAHDGHDHDHHAKTPAKALVEKKSMVDEPPPRTAGKSPDGPF